MESLPKNKYLQFNENQMEEVRKVYGLDKRRVDEAVDLLHEWVQKQAHFRKKDFTRECLEITIITTKGSVERAKTRLEKLCTFRTLWPESFAVPDLKALRKKLDMSTSVILPKPTPDHARINIFKLKGNHPLVSELISNYIKYSVVMSDYVKSHDYCTGFIIILDYMDINLVDMISIISPSALSQLMSILQEGYGMRVLGIHLVTTSKVADTFISLVKQVLSKKVGSRLHVHKTYDTLYDFVPKKILPKEYGGDDISLQKMEDAMWEEFETEEHMDLLKEMQKASTDESLRTSGDFSANYAGVSGSFRTLSVD